MDQLALPKLYHMPSAICAQKVRICLHEKGAKWESVDVGQALRSPEYLQLNPGGYVPTLVDGERVVTESRIISEYIDETFPGPSLTPADAWSRARMRLWSKQIDDSLHLNVYILSFVASIRAIFIAMPDEARARALPFDPVKRERAVDILAHEWGSKYIRGALTRFQKLIADMEQSLGRTEWLAGDAYSLADADFTPYLDRLTDLGVDFIWQSSPAVQRWIAAVRARPSFAEVSERWIATQVRTRNAALRLEVGPQFENLLAEESFQPG